MERILLLRVVKSIMGIVGIFGNGLVCIVIYKVPFMHTLTNALIFNQATLDLFGSFVLLLASNIPVPERLHDSPADWLLCRIWVGNLFLWGAFNASTLNLLSVTVERLFAIVFPFKYSRLFNRRLVVMLVCSSWIVGILEQGVYIAVVQVFTNGRCFFESSSRSRLIGTVFICIKFFVPALTMLFAYISIICVLIRGARRVGVAPLGLASAVGPEAGGGSAAPRAETRGGSLLRASKNTFITLLIVFVTFLICWTPNQIIFFLFNLGWPLDFSGVIYVVSVSLVAVNSCINPVIYGMKYKRFRQGVRKLCFGVTEEPTIMSLF